MFKDHLGKGRFFVDSQLLDILRCPQSHQKLVLVEASLLSELNTRISTGEVKNVGGKVLSQAFTQALCTADGKIVYPILENIPVLLIDESIVMESK